MDIEICVNTDDEVIAANIHANSRRNLPWIKSIAQHDGEAVIVGGGPSIIDDVEDIRWRASLGQKVFALNNAAQFLVAHDIYPDYQVIVDARPFNSRFLGYAKHNLLASQCDPVVFDTAGSNTSLWHAADDDIEKLESLFPDDYPAYAMITGGTTVGLSAMTLVYALGYRKLHLYGYDSSHRSGNRHAYPQPENSSIAECKMTVFGKTFDTSIAMAHQAEVFPQLCDILIDNGCLITVHGDGLIPWIVREMPKHPKEIMTEQEKYQAMWAQDGYRAHSPGEECASLFLNLATPKPESLIYDFGCGTGRAGRRIGWHCRVVMFDFAENCLDAEIKEALDDRFVFQPYDLVKSSVVEPKADYAYCTDVLEHIPPADVDAALNNVCGSAKKAFLQISLVPDNMGVLIGQPLHLSVHSFDWWKDKLQQYGTIEYSENHGHTAIFYLSTLTT